MNGKRRNYYALFALLAFASVSNASLEDASFTKVSSYMECSILARYANKKDEAARLFRLGIDTGREVFENIYSDDSNFSTKRADILLKFGALYTPKENASFRLGRLYQLELDDVLTKIGGARNDKTEKTRAQKSKDLFEKYNCQFLQ